MHDPCSTKIRLSHRAQSRKLGLRVALTARMAPAAAATDPALWPRSWTHPHCPRAAQFPVARLAPPAPNDHGYLWRPR